MPRSSSLIKYDIVRFTRDLEPGVPYSRAVKAHSKLAKLKAELPAAIKRELVALAKVLTYKADIYGPNGRIYSHEGKWEVRTEGEAVGAVHQLVFVPNVGSPYYVDPNTLRDGNARIITTASDL